MTLQNGKASAYRTERDTFGPIDVPARRLWGAQTQRSLQHFVVACHHLIPECQSRRMRPLRSHVLISHAVIPVKARSAYVGDERLAFPALTATRRLSLAATTR